MSDARAAPTTPRRTTRKRRDIRERMERAVLDRWELLDDEDIAIFTIRRPDGSEFSSFEAGQYTMLAFWDQPADDPRPRQLSIGSTPLDLDHLEFYVILVRDAREDGSNVPGVFTGTLWRHKPGDEILYMPRPAGRFTLSRTSQPDAVCVATGTGLAPFVSMARTAWHAYKETGQVERRLTIVHGVSYADQLGYKDELERMAADPGFGLVYIPTVSRPDSDPNFAEGMGPRTRQRHGAPDLRQGNERTSGTLVARRAAGRSAGAPDAGRRGALPVRQPGDDRGRQARIGRAGIRDRRPRVPGHYRGLLVADQNVPGRGPAEQALPEFRVGTGYDLHRLGADRPLRIAGVDIARDGGAVGHSDADVAMHALVDAPAGSHGRR